MARTKEFNLNREINKSGGKEYSNYYVTCEVEGRKAKARFIPKDNGGYSILNVLFDKAKGEPVSLSRKVTRNVNANGTSTQMVSYTAYFLNANGKKSEVTVKPYRPSDEDWMKMYIAELPDDDNEVSESEDDNADELSKAGIDVSDETRDEN